MTTAQVFISYRRDDSAGYARAIYDALARQFGDERVFIDVDDIGVGLPFTEVLDGAVGRTQVLLVLIGPRWQGQREGGPRSQSQREGDPLSQGQRDADTPRLHDPADMVHREVLAGLRNGALVIPVLLDGTPMPAAAELPAALQALSGRNALELGNTRYATDMQRLLQAIGEVLGSGVAQVAPTSRRIRLLALATALMFAAAAGGLWWSLRAPTPAPTVAASRPAINGLWQAEVVYDWPGARYTERFDFRGEAAVLQGSASFLRVPRELLEGRVGTNFGTSVGTNGGTNGGKSGGKSGGPDIGTDDGDDLQFITRTTEVLGDRSFQTVHRYRARWAGSTVDELRFVMQTEGGSTPHAAVEFVARRATPASAPGRGRAGDGEVTGR